MAAHGEKRHYKSVTSLSEYCQLFVFHFICVSVCMYRSVGAPGGQKRVLGLLKLELQLTTCRCWEPNMAPAEQQQILLTTDPSL